VKKIIAIILIIGLVLTGLTGCSSPQNSEEERKAELKARMESETDIKNKSALHQYVKEEIVDISSERFDQWQVYYFDITSDGTEEAVLVDSYGTDWYDKVEIISKDNGEFERIPSEIYLGKHSNTPELMDGFLALTSGTGGTGEQFEELSLYAYDGSKMVEVLDRLLLHHVVEFPNAQFEEIGKIDGKLTDFTYTVTKYDKKTDKTTTETKEQYTYNPNNMKFDIKTLGTQTASANQGASSQPAQGSNTSNTSNTSNNTNTGSTAAKPVLLSSYEFNKEYRYDLDSDGIVDTFTLINDLYWLKVVLNGYDHPSLYDPEKTEYELFSIVINKELVFNKYKLVKCSEDNQYHIAMFVADPPNNDEVYFFKVDSDRITKIGVANDTADLFNADIQNLSHTQAVIGGKTYSFSGNTSTNTSTNTNPNTGNNTNPNTDTNTSNTSEDGFVNETYNGTYIDYSQSRVVILPGDYNGPNKSKLTSKTYKYENANTEETFHIIGEVQNVTVKFAIGDYRSGGQSAPTSKGSNLGTFNNARLTVKYDSSSPVIESFRGIIFEGDVVYPNGHVQHVTFNRGSAQVFPKELPF